MLIRIVLVAIFCYSTAADGTLLLVVYPIGQLITCYKVARFKCGTAEELAVFKRCSKALLKALLSRCLSTL